MINNPFQLLQMFKNTTNPMALLQSMANNNPQMQQLFSNLQGKTPKQLKQYAMNVAESKGINLEQFLNQYGVRLK